MESSFTMELKTMKRTYDTLLKRKEDISEKIYMYKCKGKMFPPIVKQSCTKSMQSQAVNDRSLATTPVTPQEESEESWTINDEQLTYNMEFNVEPKKLNFSKQSSWLTKQSLHYDSFENVDEKYRTNKWTTYYDDEAIPPTEAVRDFAEYNDFIERTDMQDNMTDDNESQ